MQKKVTNVLENISEMHFAVASYEIEYSIPNDQIYSLYFEKGLQILGSTQYPIQNYEKMSKLSLPLNKNIIQFRVSSKGNIQYQWSLYKRVDEMQEFLESKKINLKTILDKEPQKSKQTAQPQKKLQGLKKRQSKLESKGQMQSESKIQRKNSNQPKGSAYNQKLVFQTGHLTINYYLFKGSSYPQLSRTIEDKVKQKNPALGQINSKIQSQTQQIPIQSQKQLQSQLTTEKQNNQSQQQSIINEVTQQLLNGQKTDSNIVEARQRQHFQTQTAYKKQNKQQSAISQRPQTKDLLADENQTKDLLADENQTAQPAVLQTAEQNKQVQRKSKELPQTKLEPFNTQYFPLNKTESSNTKNQQKAELLVAQQTQPIQNSTQQEDTPMTFEEHTNIASQENAAIGSLKAQNVQSPQFGVKISQKSDKKKIIVVVLVILLMYLASFFNLFGQQMVVAETKHKKSKKDKFQNRKKSVNQ